MYVNKLKKRITLKPHQIACAIFRLPTAMMFMSKLRRNTPMWNALAHIRVEFVLEPSSLNQER